MNPALQALLRAARNRSATGAAGPMASAEQLASFTDLLFPDPKEHFQGSHSQGAATAGGPSRQHPERRHERSAAISPGWLDALSLLELARLVDTAQAATGDAAPVEGRAAAHVLNAGHFPQHPQAAELVAAVLQRWRDLDSTQLRGGSGGPHWFPPSLSAQAGSRLAYQLSLRDPAAHRHGWEEALALYQHVARQHAAATTATSATTTTATATTPAAPTRQNMAAVRHTVLVTLLRACEWGQALRFFEHSLYQKDMPDSVSTGFLLQALGKAGKVDEVTQIYTLCVKLLTAQLARGGAGPAPQLLGQQRQRLRKQWGTTLAMAMSSVSEHQPERVEAMLGELNPVAPSVVALPSPLALLDGNFLAAVQRVPRQEDRQRLLERARRAGLLDYFKLIRGLVSVGRVEEALLVFTEGVAAVPPALARKEVGSSRLLIISGTPYDKAERTLTALHAATKRDCPVLRMNDAEVETLLAKASTIPAGAPAKAYWDLCQRTMSENYGGFMDGEPRPRRRPSLAALSFFMRSPTLPWEAALRMVGSLDGLAKTHAHPRPADGPGARRRSNHTAVREAQGSGGGGQVPAEVLLLNAASELVYRQGPPGAAAELAMRAMREYGSSPSADFLRRCPAADLRRLLVDDGVTVDPRVLHHLLREAARGGPSADRPTATTGTPQPPRALQIVSLLMERACPDRPAWLGSPPPPPTASAASRPAARRPWLTAVPASVHCEALVCVRQCVLGAAEQWRLTAAYLGRLALPTAQQPRRDPRARAELLQSHYNATWEAIITMAGLPPADIAACFPEASGNGTSEAKVDTIGKALAAATVRCDFLPPAHMLLPNQMDRLLPPPQRAGAPTALESGAEATACYERCCATQCLIVFAFQLAERRYERPAAAVEPVVLHGLLKLCCRVGEYAAALLPEQRTRLEERLRGLGCPSSLADLAAQLLDWQAKHNGARAVSPQSLSLLYALCAIAGGKAEGGRGSNSGSDSGGGGAIALAATEKLLAVASESAAARPRSRDCRAAEASLAPDFARHRQRRGDGPVLASHYAQFSRRFGWELGLRVWYESFPKEVLLGVAHSPAALNYCLSLSE